MKKFSALAVVLVVLSGAVFAEVTVTGQVDATVMPLQVSVPDKGDTLVGAGVGRNGSGDASRARIGISATNDTKQVGINFKIQFNPNVADGKSSPKLGFDDFAEVWWQPISQLKIEAGKFVNDTLRGKIGDDNWQRYTARMKDPDGIFSRFKSNTVGDSDVGFMLGIKPIDPLFIGVSVPSVVQLGAGFPDTVTGKYTYWEVDDDKLQSEWSINTEGNVAHTYEKIQIGAGYTIENIGLFRAQYVGASYIYDSKTYANGFGTFWQNNLNVRRIEAAFAYTGMAGLVIDVGGKVPLSFKTLEVTGFDYDTGKTDEDGNAIKAAIRKKIIDGDWTYQAPFQVSLGAGYTADALDIKGRVDVQFGGSAKYDKTDGEYNLGPDINVHLWPSYNLGFATAGLDVGFNYIGKNTNEDGDVIGEGPGSDGEKGGYKFGIGAWLRKSIGSCSIKGGLGLSLGEVHGEKQPTVFSVPIIFDYSF
jgi:hypothetical protein